MSIELRDLDSHQEGEPFEKLPRVAQSIPAGLACWRIAAVELCERFAFYGLTGPFMNYMQYSPLSKIRGALGLGSQKAVALSYFFQFWCFLCPVLGAWISDSLWGKYKTIKIFSFIYIVGIFVLLMTSVPYAIDRGYAFGGFMMALVIIGLGTGGVKANVSPLIADCVPKFQAYVRTTGRKKEVVDPQMTIQRVFMVFYLCINFGSLSSVLTTLLENRVGFWAAYTLPFSFFWLGLILFVTGKRGYTHVPPRKNVIGNCFSIAILAARNKGNFEQCKNRAGWTNEFVDEVRCALNSCKVFCFFVIYWAVYGQMLTNFVSQAGQMELHGIPNDMMGNIDPITIIVFIPIFDNYVYPKLASYGFELKPITKISWGFFVGAAAMVYAAWVQKLIYSAGPCFDMPLQCTDSMSGTIPNNVHVLIQAPAYFLIAISEILASVTGLEYAYTQAPKSMTSFVMSIFLLTSAGGSIIGMLISPFAINGYMVSYYIGLAFTCLAAGMAFWYTFKHLNENTRNDQEEAEFLLD